MRPKQAPVLLTLALLSFAVASPAFSAASSDARATDAHPTYRTILVNDHHGNDGNDWNWRQNNNHHDNDHHGNNGNDWNWRQNNDHHSNDGWDRNQRDYYNAQQRNDPNYFLNKEQYNHSDNGRDAWGRSYQRNNWWNDFWGNHRNH